MEELLFQELSLNQIDKIKPLWESLNRVHLDDSVFFKDHYSAFTFEKRSARWKTMSDEDILIIVAETKDKELIGYCVSTMDEMKEGEIDSLFVYAEYRRLGVGKTLTEKSLEWLRSKNCKSIRLAVSYGHESVLGFYEKIGFFPRMTVLEWNPVK